MSTFEARYCEIEKNLFLVAVIVPEAPVRVLLSGDGGSSWRSVTITGSGAMESLGEWVTDMAYYGGYIGFDQADIRRIKDQEQRVRGQRLLAEVENGDHRKDLG